MRDNEHSIHEIRNRCMVAGVLIAVLATGGCRKSTEQEPELEAVDVGPALEIGTEDDVIEVERPPELVGILPEDFPDDLPIYLPASLVDFGPADGGWVYVNLLTPHALARVERELSARLRDNGWTVTASGGGKRLRKGGARARLLVKDARPGTEFRFEYPGR